MEEVAMVKKRVALLIVVAMVSLMLCSCSNNSRNDDDFWMRQGTWDSFADWNRKQMLS